MINLRAPCPIFLQVPALATAGVEAPFELRLMSPVPLELVPLPELCSCMLQVRLGDVVHGAWHCNCVLHVVVGMMWCTVRGVVRRCVTSHRSYHSHKHRH